MKKSIRRVVTALVIVAVGAGAFTILRGSPEEVPPVPTVKAQLADLRSITSATGTVQPIRQIALSFPTVGRLTAVNVEPGQLVKAGDVLAEVDSTAAAIEVKTRKAALKEAVARAQGLKTQVTAADRAVYQATLESAESTAAQAAKTEAQLKDVSQSSAEQLETSIDLAAQQQARDEAQLAVDDAKLTEAQAKLQTETTSLADAKVGLDTAKANLQVAQKQRDTVRDELARSRQDVANVGPLRDEAQRTLDRVTADYERLRIAASSNVDANGVPILSAVSDSAVVSARNALTALQERIARLEVEVVRVQGTLEAAIDGVAVAERELANAQTKFDKIDGNITTNKASVETAKSKVESQREAAAKSADAVESARVAKAAGVTKDEQAMVTAQNSRVSAEEAARVAAREKRQRSQGAKPTEIQAALAQVDSAAAAVELAQSELAKAKLLAPFDGLVSTVGVKVGEQVGTSAAALGTAATGTKEGATGTIVLVDATTLVIKLPLPEIDAARVVDGAEASALFESVVGSKAVPAEVTAIEPTPTVINGVSTYTARVLINDVPKSVRLGMTATVEILLGVRKQVLTLPAGAVSEKDGVVSVSLVSIGKDGKQLLTPRTVEIGERGDGKVEITKGLKVGQTVATEGVETDSPASAAP